jgi:peptidoglycan/xylan/chitin deacetylase (PgdA/CDA1 family)
VLVVTYHAIASSNTPVTVTRERLTSHLEALADSGYRFLHLADLSRALHAGLEPPRDGVAITFDDGYASVATDAWPILESRGVPATLFVIAGRLGQDNRWPGQAPWVETKRLADAGALRELAAAGADIGGHSWSHPRLTTLTAGELDREVKDAADHLEQIVQQPVRHFAYPYGAYGPREAELAAGRYDLAVTAECRRVVRGTSRESVGRLDAHDLHLASAWHMLDSAWLDGYLTARRGLHRLSAPLR